MSLPRDAGVGSAWQRYDGHLAIGAQRQASHRLHGATKQNTT
jgi:hypothetical protein